MGVQLLGAQCPQQQALGGQRVAGGGPGQLGVDLLGQRLHQRRRRAGGRQQGIPTGHLDTAHALLGQRGDVGCGGGAHAVGDAQRAQLAALDLGQHAGQVGEHQRHAVAQHIGQRLGRAFVGHMQQVGAGLQLEQLARQVQAAAHAGRRTGQLAGLGPGQRQQLARVARRQRRVGDQHIRRLGQHRDRGKVWLHLVGQVGQQRRVDRQVAGRHHQQGLAVGRRALDRLDPQIAGRAGFVVDDGRLTMPLLQAGGQQAGQQIDRAAGRERGDQLPRALQRARLGGGRGGCLCLGLGLSMGLGLGLAPGHGADPADQACEHPPAAPHHGLSVKNLPAGAGPAAFFWRRVWPSSPPATAHSANTVGPGSKSRGCQAAVS